MFTSLTIWVWCLSPYVVFCSITLFNDSRDGKPAEPGLRGLPAAAEGHAERAGVQAAIRRQRTERPQ